MTTKTKINIQGMADESSVKSIEEALLKLTGVASVVVDLSGKTADVEYDSTLITIADFMNALETVGFDVV